MCTRIYDVYARALVRPRPRYPTLLPTLHSAISLAIDSTAIKFGSFGCNQTHPPIYPHHTYILLSTERLGPVRDARGVLRGMVVSCSAYSLRMPVRCYFSEYFLYVSSWSHYVDGRTRIDVFRPLRIITWNARISPALLISRSSHSLRISNYKPKGAWWLHATMTL